MAMVYALQGMRTVSGNSGSYSFTGLLNGQYLLTVSKKNHATREYEVTILLGSKTQDVKIHPVGDINGDGKITNYDYSRVNQHTSDAKKLTDYAFSCADVNSDGKVTNFDAGKINQHASNTKKLW